MANSRSTTLRRYTFRITRWVKEMYEVEVVASATPELKKVKGLIQDPYRVTVEREIIQQVKP